jgi:3-deoxy-manno-octulosonate cytidylyltransferase (CMP-KDO synthetase)
MSIIGIIPARMASTRFPGKPLAKICGIPMVGHVYFRCKMSRILDDVYIATCDKEIEAYGRSIGAGVIMTKNSHQRASDRCAEAMLKIESQFKKKIDIVVMIQGDEPMIIPRMIDLAVKPMINDTRIKVVNLIGKIKGNDNPADPNLVKVVVDDNYYALYFSREPIPSIKKWPHSVNYWKQIPIIPFTRDFLIKFNRLKPTYCEQIESVDMLRVLEHGFQIKMVPSPYETHSVDIPKELKDVEKLMKYDILMKKYAVR